MKNWLAGLLGYPNLYKINKLLLKTNKTLLENDRKLMAIIVKSRPDIDTIVEIRDVITVSHIELLDLEVQMKALYS